jgi:hypothetical protein
LLISLARGFELPDDLGYSAATMGSLIGYKGRTSTSRYLHSADAVLLAAADVVAGETAKRMGETKAGAEDTPAIAAADYACRLPSIP